MGDNGGFMDDYGSLWGHYAFSLGQAMRKLIVRITPQSYFWHLKTLMEKLRKWTFVLECIFYVKIKIYLYACFKSMIFFENMI